MNLYDIILAGKVNGGGGGAPIEEIKFTATSWSELPAINISEYFPASSLDFGIDIGILEFNFNGLTVSIPVTVSNLVAYKEIAGGVCNSMGTAAVMSLTYDSEGEEWSVSKAFTNMLGTWIDITSDVQTDATDIILTLFK